MPQVTSKNSSAPSSMSKPVCASHFRCVLLSILFLVIAFFAGLYIGGQNSLPPSANPPVGINTQASDQKATVQKGSYEDGYQAALDFARKKLSDKGMFGLGKNTIPNATVKSVNGNQITIEFDSSRLDIFSEGMTTKTIIIPNTVKIEKRTPKDPAEVQKAFDEFKIKYDEFLNTAKTVGEMNNPPKKPMPYTVENVSLADIKAGDIISVTYEIDASKPDTLNALSVVLNTAPSETVTPPKAEAPISSAPKSEISVADITSGNTPAPSAQPSGTVTTPTAEAPSQTEPTPVK